jgi:AcrR family transcriptional regulator
MERQGTQRAKRGRPRTPGTDEAILHAARSILSEEGWEAFSLGKVAQMANVGKPTVYRRWPSRAALVYDALFSTRPDSIPLPETSSARDDFLAGMRSFAARFDSNASFPASRAILAEIMTDTVVSHRFILEQMDQDHETITDVLQRSDPEGRRPREHYKLLAEVAVAWIVHRCVIMANPPSEAEITTTVDVIMAGA